MRNWLRSLPRIGQAILVASLVIGVCVVVRPVTDRMMGAQPVQAASVQTELHREVSSTGRLQALDIDGVLVCPSCRNPVPLGAIVCPCGQSLVKVTRVCRACKGEKTITCPKCHGEGSPTGPCPNCGGNGILLFRNGKFTSSGLYQGTGEKRGRLMHRGEFMGVKKDSYLCGQCESRHPLEGWSRECDQCKGQRRLECSRCNGSGIEDSETY